jgi:surface carbohydrate biosynthesis protein
MRIALFPMIKARDMMGLAFLKMQLEKRGHEVRIMGDWEYYRLYKWLPELIVVPDTINGGPRRLSRFMKRKGAHVVLLHSEGLTSTYVEKLWAGGCYQEKDLEDLEIVWGQKTKDILIKYGKEPEKLRVCGCPRFDKYKWRLLDKKEFLQAHGFDPEKKIVLYATNLVWFKGRDYSVNLESHMIEDFESTREKLEQLRETTTKYFFDCVRHFEEVLFIIKLHPEEDRGRFNQYVDKYSAKNVLVYQDEMEVADLINICDILIHWNSTSAMEAWILNKPTISMVFTNEVDYYLTESAQYSALVRNYETLVKKIEYYLRGGKDAAELLDVRKKTIENLFYKVDGKSTARCVELIDHYLQSHAIRVKRTMNAEDMKLIFNDYGQIRIGEKSMRQVLSLLPLNMFNLHMPSVRPPSITIKEVEDLEKDIRRRTDLEKTGKSTWVMACRS